MTPWLVPELWPGSTMVCIAGGPSLTAADVAAVQGRAPCIVVNDGYRLAPWADVLYFCDSRWWEWHRARPEYKAFAGIKVTMAENVAKAEPGVHWVKNGGGSGLAKKRDELATGSNGGYQAIGLAVHLGAKRIVLLGYDMRLGVKGEQHWFGKHPGFELTAKNVEALASRFPEIVAPLKDRGIEVLNATPGSALDCFPRRRLADCLLSSAG